MIIILSAPSCTGKTLMANNLMKRYQIPFTMMDNIKMALYRSDPTCGFHPEDTNRHIANHLWPFLREMIKTSIENQQDMILEGCYILPDHLMSLEADYRQEVLPVFFGFSRKYLMENFESGLLAHRMVVEERDGPEDRPLSVFLEDHEDLKAQCLAFGVTYFEIQEDYGEVSQIYAYIDDYLRRSK